MSKQSTIRLIAFVLLFVTLGTAGCIPKAATLKVGTEATLPPFESRDKDGKLIGFDMDLAQEIATKLKRKLEIVDMSFDGLIPALEGGNVDLVIAALMITDKRKERIDFTNPYCAVRSACIVKKGNPKNLHSLADLAGKTIAVQLGTTYDNFATGLQNVTVNRFGSYVDVFNEVNLGRADCVVCISTNLFGYRDRFPDLEVAFDFGDVMLNVKGIGVRKGSTDLLNKVNTILQDLEQSGKMQQLKTKWFGALSI